MSIGLFGFPIQTVIINEYLKLLGREIIFTPEFRLTFSLFRTFGLNVGSDWAIQLSG